MSSESSYQKLRKALDEARAQNASDEDIIATLVANVPLPALKALYREAVRRNKSDLSSAIESALFSPSNSSPALPPQALATAKASGDPLDAAIAGAFGPRRSSTTKSTNTIPSADGPRYGRLNGGKK